MLRLTKKKFVLGAAAVCVMAIAAGAYAYFTASTGSGTATATVGSSSAVVIKATIASVYPGSSSTVNFTVDNSSKAAQRVGTISVTKVEPDASHSGCVTTYGEATSNVFYMTPVAANQVIPPETSAKPITATGSLQMRDSGVNQDNCQGANLTLTLKSE